MEIWVIKALLIYSVMKYYYYREKILKVLLTKVKYELLLEIDHVALFHMSLICLHVFLLKMEKVLLVLW